MPNVSKDYLISQQNKTSWIATILSKIKTGKKSHQEFYLFHGILIRKKQLKNSIWVDQIVIPDNLARPIIQNLHKMDYFHHLGAIPMERQLMYYFFIKNFINIAIDIVQHCEFCLLNKEHPNRRLEPGLRIHIDKPRQFIYLDICTVRSEALTDSFLTILNGFSHFVIFIPINRNASAQEVCELIFENWIRHYGFPLVISRDGGSAFVN